MLNVDSHFGGSRESLKNYVIDINRTTRLPDNFFFTFHTLVLHWSTGFESNLCVLSNRT